MGYRDISQYFQAGLPLTKFKAEGGRIGLRNGGNGDHPLHDDYWEEFNPDRDQMTEIKGQTAEFKPVGIEELVEPIYKKLREQGMSHEEAVKEIFKMLQGKAQGEKSGIMTASDPGMGEGPFMLDEFLQAVKEGYKGTYDDFINDIDRSPADYMGAKG